MQHTTTSNQPAAADTTLYQHVVKPDWGLAILAWERDGKRAYQFEDGELRVFKDGYYHFLKELDRPRDETSRTLDELNAKLGRRRARKRNGSEHPAIPVSAQIEYFRAAFPKGFKGAKWAKKHRGLDAKKRLKRHRSPALTAAAERITRERVEAAIAAGGARDLLLEIAELVNDTDLVTKTHLRGIERASEAPAARALKALAVLLWSSADHGDSMGEMKTSFERFQGALARCLPRKASWQLATAIPALVAPKRFICVKPTSFKRQAAWMAPNLILDKRPSGAVYERLCGMAFELGRRLEDAGLAPRDQMDVYDFIQVTMRPKAIGEMSAAMKKNPSEAQTAPDPSSTAAA